jgi:hypothetical protein
MALPNLRNLVNSNKASAIEGGGAALVTLALGGSKAEAAMAGLGQALAHKVLGPLSLVAGMAYGALKGVFSLTKGFASMGVASAASMEKVQNQLRVMLKGLDAAKQRVREMQAFSVKTPFSMKDVVAGNRVMESLGRGALSTKEMMTQVGDAAAQAGTDFEQMSIYVGRLYDGLAAGRPVGEVLFRLAELGVVSGAARTRLEQLQASGAGFAEVWGVVEQELKRSKGTMDYTSRTLEGMQQAVADAQDQMQASFSMNFLEGQKEAMQAQMQTMQNLTPVAADLGQAFGSVITIATTFKDKALAMVTSWKPVQVVMSVVARAVALLSVAIVGLASVVGVVRIYQLVSGVAALGKAALVARLGVTALGRSLLLLASGPFVLLAAALLLLGSGLMMIRDKAARTSAALREYQGATRSLITQLQAQAAAIKTLDELSLGYQQTLAKLREAYEQEADAALAGEGKKQKAARDKITALKEHLAYLDKINRAGLEQPQNVVDTMTALKGNRRNNAAAEREANRAKMTPEGRAADSELEANELLRRREAAAREIAGQMSYTEGGAEAQTALARNRTDQKEVQEAFRGRGLDDPKKQALNPTGYAMLTQRAAELKTQEIELAKAVLMQAEASGSEIAVMQEKLKIWDQWVAVQADVEAAQNAVTEATLEEDKDGKKAQKVRELTIALEDQLETRRRLAEIAGMAKMDPRTAQAMRAEVERRKAETGADIMNRPEEIAKRDQAERERKAADAAGRNAELDVTVAGAGLDGRLASEQAALDAERQRLEIQARTESMDERIYAARRKLLEIDQLRLNTQKEIAKQERTGEFKAGGFDLRAQAARLGGRGDKMREMEEKAALAREEAGRKAREQALMDTGLTDEEAKGQTQAEFNRNRMSREMDRQGSLLGVAMGERSVSDSMARIGGGGSTYGGGDIKAITDRLDKLIKAVEEQEAHEAKLR